MLEANIGDLVITGKGVFTVESINTTQTQEGASISIDGHSRSGWYHSVKVEEGGAYKVIASPTIEQANEAYARERQLEQLVANIRAYEETHIVSRYYTQNPNAKLALTLISPNAVKGTRAKMGKLERELNALREWVMERYLEYSTEVATTLEAHRNPFAPEEGATTPVLFGALEEALTRIGKHERWQYGKERAETRVEAIENAVFEMLTEINKAILGARQVTRQVENFYAGK